jgi:hypothetical protein
MAGTTAAALLKRMTEMDVTDVDKDFIGAIYGPIGSGKTIAAVQLAQALTQSGRILYIDSSDGWVSLSDKQFADLREGVTRLRIKSYDDFHGIAEAFAKNDKSFRDFDVIVLDEGTSIAERIVSEVALDAHGDEAIVEGKDYRPVELLYMKALNKLHDTEGLSVIIVAHDRTDKIGKGEDAPTITSMGYTPQLGKKVAKLMHVVAYLDATIKGSERGPEYVRELQAQPTRRISAKSRVGDMPLRLTVPEFIDRVVEWVDGSLVDDLQAPEPQVAVTEDEDVAGEEFADDEEPVYDEQD